MKLKKTYEKQRNHLTKRRKCVTICKQSAPTVFYLKNRRTVKQVCEGGGTGRRARLRCVWFILGGSSPLPRIKENPRSSDRSWVFLMLSNQSRKQKGRPGFLSKGLPFCMQEKGLEPSLTGNWCLKPARLPFRHSCTENLFSLSIFAGNVNSSACFCILQIFSGSYPIRDTADPMRFVKEVDRKSTRLNSSHNVASRMPSSA